MNWPTSFADIPEAISSIFQYQLFEINRTPITLFSMVMFVFLIAAFFVFSRVLNRGLRRKIFPRFQLDLGMQHTFSRITHYVIMLVGTLVAFQFMGIDLSGLTMIFGLLSVGIGFGLQNVASNFVSGLILLFERPIRVGDRVTVGDTEGDVMAINMRATHIRSLDNITIIVPNSEFIASEVINWSHGDPKIRLNIEVGVSYGSDLELVIKALQEAAAEHPEVLKSPEPLVLLREFGDSSWNMSLRAWIGRPEGHHVTRSEINGAIVRKFREYGIEIPFPQRDLHVRSPLPVPFVTREAPATPSAN
jgi:small-conductance mechanosensitive channel